MESRPLRGKNADHGTPASLKLFQADMAAKPMKKFLSKKRRNACYVQLHEDTTAVLGSFFFSGWVGLVYKLSRRTLLQGGGCEGLALGHGYGDSTPSVFRRKLLSCSDTDQSVPFL